MWWPPARQPCIESSSGRAASPAGIAAESAKGSGFQQPLTPHEHWHVDISYVNVCGTFYYLTSVLDGCESIYRPLGTPRIDARGRRGSRAAAGSRKIPCCSSARDHRQWPAVHRPRLPRVHPPVRHDPRPHESLLSADRTAKSNVGTVRSKRDCLRPNVPLSLDEARQLVAEFVAHYNHVRLHSAIGYVTPADKLAGREEEIFAERDRKLEAARERRRQARWLASACDDGLQHQTTWAEDRATQRCDPSADPGDRDRRMDGALHVPSSFPFDLGHQSDKPDWHDATDTTAGCLTKSLTPEGQNSISR